MANALKDKVTIIGAGLAGSEAAWQIAQRGVQVDLYEMRPAVMTPAHHTGWFAELVCSNSLRANNLENAAGLLKEEMRRLNSLIMKAADATQVPAGGALAVDRGCFSQYITSALTNHQNINIINSKLTELPENRPLIIATGPLTSESLIDAIGKLTGKKSLYFYDAAAPIVTVESLDFEKIYFASRYGKKGQTTEITKEVNTGCPNLENTADENDFGKDYLNCPMNKEQYETFWQELVNAQTVPLKEFEKPIFFEGCMPIEEMAARGIETMRFGPLKPVGLENPKTGERPHAVVQLRQDNYAATLYNIVGFQTHLKWPEQKRVFSLIPGLENAEFVRFGVMHRNTFINSPQILRPTMQMIEFSGIFFAGQITGVEGYIESAASGLVAGINAARLITGNSPVVFSPETAHGALCHYASEANQNKKFQPMNINFGLLPPLEKKPEDKKIKNKKLKNTLIAQRALEEIGKINF